MSLQPVEINDDGQVETVTTAPVVPVVIETPIFVIEPEEEGEQEPQPSLAIEDQVDEIITSPDVLLRLARGELEHVKRGAALAVQLLERFAQEIAELREHQESRDARIEALEEAIAGAVSVRDIPELQQFLCLTDKLAQEEAEVDKMCEQLPRTSPHHGDKPVAYKDRFLDSFRELDRPRATRVVKQLSALFNRGHEHSSLQTKRIWHEDLPGTPKGSWSCKAGSGGHHALRFTWADADVGITVFGIYPRNDLF